MVAAKSSQDVDFLILYELAGQERTATQVKPEEQ
jgi:hypothetical protein